MPAPTVSLTYLRTLARRLSDMENTDFVTDAEIDTYVRLGILDLYDQLDQVSQQEHFLKTVEIPLLPPQNVYDLPADFARVKGVDFSTSPFPPVTETLDDGSVATRWVPDDEKTNVYPIKPYTFFDRNRLNQGAPYGPTTVAPYDAEEMKYRVFTEKVDITTETPQPDLIVCNPEPCQSEGDYFPDGWASTDGVTSVTFSPWGGDPSGAPFVIGNCIYAFGGDEELNCYGIITDITYNSGTLGICPETPEGEACCNIIFQIFNCYEGPDGNTWYDVDALGGTCLDGLDPELDSCVYFNGSFRGRLESIVGSTYTISSDTIWNPIAECLPPESIVICPPPASTPDSLTVTFSADCTDIVRVRPCGPPDFPVPQPPIITTVCSYYDRIRFQKVKQGYALVWYLPRHPDIEECGFVGYGFEEYPAIFAAIRMLRKEESDYSGLNEDLEMMKKRIRTMAGIRDVGHPVPTQDTSTGWE